MGLAGLVEHGPVEVGAGVADLEPPVGGEAAEHRVGHHVGGVGRPDQPGREPGQGLRVLGVELFHLQPGPDPVVTHARTMPRLHLPGDTSPASAGFGARCGRSGDAFRPKRAGGSAGGAVAADLGAGGVVGDDRQRRDPGGGRRGRASIPANQRGAGAGSGSTRTASVVSCPWLITTRFVHVRHGPPDDLGVSTDSVPPPLTSTVTPSRARSWDRRYRSPCPRDGRRPRTQCRTNPNGPSSDRTRRSTAPSHACRR